MSAHVTAGVLGLIKRVDQSSRAFLDGRAEALAPLGADLEPVAAAARAFVLDGGKRLRPLFAYWGWRAVRTRRPTTPG